MKITLLEKNDVKLATTFFNQNIKAYALDYKPMSEQVFKDSFYTATDIYKPITILSKIDEQIIGFASGIHMIGQEVAYLTFLMVDKNHQHKGYAHLLLTELEKQLATTNPLINKIEIVFFNPIHLIWNIPQNPGVEHPNAPGVDITSQAFAFFKKHDYHQYAIQNSYFRKLASYAHSTKTLNILSELEKIDITISIYDSKLHRGFDELFESLQTKSWTNEINKAIKNKLPILVALKQNLIIGFAGPLYVEDSMRGYFAGIGIHASYRGLGIGTILFSGLCENLKLIGASYMTLFTGENNPARKIYESHGFNIVKTWSDIRKTLNK